MPENPNLTTEDALGNPPSLPTKPIIPGDAPPPPLPGAGSTAPFFSGSLPPQTQLDVDFSRGRVLSPRIPKNSLMPLGIQSNPSTNAGVNSTGRVLTKTPGFTNMDLVNNGQTRVAMAKASSTPGSTGGSVAFNFRGVWLAVVPYFKGDEVIYQTSYWMATAASTNSAPATGNANWQVVGSYAAFRGPWSSSTAYVAGDEVTYNGNFWVATTANTNSAPSTSNSNWVIAGPNNLDAVQDGNTFGRMPISNYGQQTPIGKMTGLEVSSNADLEFGLTGYSVYDNNASGSVTITTVSDSASPNGNGIKMKIVEAKVGAGPTPGLGGFTYNLRQDNGVISGDTYHLGSTYIIDLVANIPVGYTLNFNNNSLGTGGSFQYLNSSLAGSSTAPVGTGNWQHYLVKVIIGTSPSSTNAFPFFYLTGADGVTWYVAGMEILDIDQHPRKGGGPIHIGPYPTGTKFGHGIGINGAGGSVGIVMHGGINRKFLTTDPFYGIYGSPSLPHQIFVNGGYVGHDVSSVNNPRMRVNSTGGGREYSFMSNVDGTARINDETGGAARTYLNSTPQWGFYGSPGWALEVQAANQIGNFKGNNNVSWMAQDTQASGRGIQFGEGIGAAGTHNVYDFTGGAARITHPGGTTTWGFYGTPGNAVEAFVGNIGQVRSNGTPGHLSTNDTQTGGLIQELGESSAISTFNILSGGNTRTYLPNSANWGFYGSPSTPLDIFGNTARVSATTPDWAMNDTTSGGRQYSINSGSSGVGYLNLHDDTGNASRTFLNSTPNWGFYGSPGVPVDIFGSVAEITNNGSNPQLYCNDTEVSGTRAQFGSGFPSVGNMFLYNNGNLRYNCNSSGDTDLAGGTPNSGFLSAGGVNWGDKSGNLKLKNIANAAGSTVGPTTSSTTYATIPQMTATITTKGNNVLISFAATLFCTAGSGLMSAFWAVFRDGSQLSGDYEVDVLSTEGALGFSATALWIDNPSAASHTFDIRWKAGGASGTTVKAIGVARSLQVVELG